MTPLRRLNAQQGPSSGCCTMKRLTSIVNTLNGIDTTPIQVTAQFFAKLLQ